MSFDPYDATQATLLATTIPATKDETVKQNISNRPGKRNEPGTIVASWSVGAEDGSADAPLAIGTYKTGVTLPKGAILLAIPLINVWEAKAGSGTITPSIGAVAMAAVSSAGIVADDDGAGNVFVRGYEAAADMAITVAVASDTVTAGGFTMYIEYVIGDQAVSQLKEVNP
jgi:hypothetical protein